MPASGLAITLTSAAEPQKSVFLRIADGCWSRLDKRAALTDSTTGDFALRLFLDRSFLECCWGDGNAWLTKAIPYLPAPIRLSIGAGGNGNTMSTHDDQTTLAALYLRAWHLSL